MKFCLLVSAAPYTHQASDSAYNFAVAALQKGHHILRVFFYHDGVNHGRCFVSPPNNERHIGKLWSTLATQHDFELTLCIAAAQRRGISHASDAKAQNPSITAGYDLLGLGQFVETTIEADRIITFGA